MCRVAGHVDAGRCVARTDSCVFLRKLNLRQGTDPIDYYAQQAVEKVDPAFAELARQQLLANGRGIKTSSDLAAARIAADNTNSLKQFYSDVNKAAAQTLSAYGTTSTTTTTTPSSAVVGTGGLGNNG